MSRRRPAPPAPPECFPAPFRALLRDLLERGRGPAGASDQQRRARRRALGQSGTFVGHRPYARGDDLRRIDWAAYARSGELFVKQLEEEERRSVALLLDLSPRLACGTPPRRLWLLRLAAILGGLALQHLDGLTVLAPGAGPHGVATFAGAADLDRLLQHLAALPTAAAAPWRAVELLLQRGVPGRVHWLSDFADPAAAERVLAALGRRGLRVVGWLPEVPEDRLAPAPGLWRVVDPETDAELEVPVDAALAAALQAELAALQRRQERAFAQGGAVLHRWPVPAAAADAAATAARCREVLAWTAR